MASISIAMAFGQNDSLSLASGVASPDGAVSLNLSLSSGQGTPPAGLQWTMAYSPADIVSISAAAGPAAAAAGKSLSCAGTSGSYTCLLAGLNANTIPDGVAAIVTLTISPGTAATTIGVAGALGASTGGSAIAITATGSSITTSSLLGLTLLTCAPSSLNAGASTSCTVTLNQAAPAGGGAVTLASNNPALTIPASVAVAGGALSAAFTATAGALTSNQNATITASFNGSVQTATLSLIARLLVTSLACSPTSLNAGAGSTCTVTISGAAPSGGATVSLSAGGPALVTPTAVVVPALSSTATFAVSAASVAPPSEESVALTATLDGASQSVPFTVMCPCSVWSTAAQPLNPASAGKQPIEVGMKFSSAVSGYVTGVRFFKGSTNIGTHTGSLWSATGTLLARVIFSNETPSGWQTAYFSSPIAIAVQTTYVISYHSPKGHNAADNGYFTNSGVTNAPLEAPADCQTGPNGVYINGGSAFPNTAASGTNFWVDVVFNLSPTVGTAAPVSLWSQASAPATRAAAVTAGAELGTKFISEAAGYVTGIRFYKSAQNTGTHFGYLWNATGTLLGSVTFSRESATGWQQADFATPIPIAANTVYVISYWSPNGHYADDAGYFGTSGVTAQMLYAPIDGQYGPNGLFAASEQFPATATQSSNYWVDLVFTTAIQ